MGAHLEGGELHAQRHVVPPLEQRAQHAQANPGIVQLARERVALAAAARPDGEHGRGAAAQQVLHESPLAIQLLPHRLLVCRAPKHVLDLKRVAGGAAGRRLHRD